MAKLSRRKRQYQFYQNIGMQTIVHACSAALLVICHSPIYGFTKRVEESNECLQFIMNGGLGRIASAHFLNIDIEALTTEFFERAYYRKDQNDTGI